MYMKSGNSIFTTISKYVKHLQSTDWNYIYRVSELTTEIIYVSSIDIKYW